MKADAYAAMAGYASLLLKWEKRESQGQLLLQDAKEFLKSNQYLPSASYENAYRTCSFIQLPEMCY